MQQQQSLDELKTLKRLAALSMLHILPLAWSPEVQFLSCARIPPATLPHDSAILRMVPPHDACNIFSEELLNCILYASK